jgi:hypothetical protein
MKNTRKKLVFILVSVTMAAQACLYALPVSVKADTTALITDYQPTINEIMDASGFKHPGVGLTKDILENMRTEVLAQKEPWNTYFNVMLTSSSASKTVTSSNQSADPTKPGTVAFNSQGVESKFISDALKSYTQALLYYVTGAEIYRANALHIIRIWSQMDPTKYAYYTDACIHSGMPLNRMVNAAETLRYTSCKNESYTSAAGTTEDLNWTDKDTVNFTNNLINPVIDTFQHDNNHFMNQHLYPLIGAMSGYIFTGNRDRYNEGAEWFTVNKTAVDQGQNGAIKQLFRLVDTNALTGDKVNPPLVEHVEMGRDQAHGAGDVTNMEILSRLLLAQGTKVDPIDGTVSAAANAVGPYEFLDNRILKAADYFGQFMLGYDTPWVPTAAHTDANGNPTIIYKQLAGGYRGRLTPNTWELYYYYKYTAGINMEEVAPHFTQMFADRVSYNWDGVDGGGDFWITIPKAAEAEGTKYLVKTITDPYRQIEDRYTAFDSNSSTMQEGDISFVRINATEAGSKIALAGSGTSSKTIAFRIRTNGTAKLEMTYSINDRITLPDTKGQWRYVTYTMNNFQGFGDLAYFTVKGAGTIVDIDHININAGTLLTPPVYTAGNTALNLFTYVGSQATINYDFSATDSSGADIVTYQIDNKPKGAVFNESTGAFSWQPTQAGTYSFIVEASDGTSVTTRDVKVVVTNDRQSAIDVVIAPYNANTIYISSTLDNYKKVYADVMSVISSASDDVFYQKLSGLNSAVQGLQQLTPLISDGSMDYTNMFVSSTFGTAIPNLLDNSPDSFVGYSSAVNLTHTMDFGPSYKVSASAFQLQVRASFPERIGGTTIFGSNDNVNWTRLTPGETTVTEDMQTLAVDSQYQNQKFRFLKIQMIHPSSSMLEIAEFRIFGQRYETVNKLSTVSISSDQSLKNRIVAGNTIKLSFQSTEAISNVNVTIQGQPATVTNSDNLNWTAALVVDKSTPAGTVKFNLNYKTAAGIDAELTTFTTDSSTLYLVDESDVIKNVTSIANLIDSSYGRTAQATLSQVTSLFDGNTGTFSDFRTGTNNSGTGAYIIFDFKAGNQATLTSVELLARQDQVARIKGTVVQGSNDNTTWTTLTPAAASVGNWQTLAITSKVPYRYIKIYNGGTWYGSMAEVRLHGVVKAADVTAPVTTDNAPQGWVNKDTTVNFNAVDGSSGVQATYYRVDGGAQQTGSSVTLTTEGTHTLVYWSVDWAGNVEQQHTATVKIDKTAPVTVATVNPSAPNGSNGWYISDVTISLSASDDASGVSSTEYSLDGGNTWVNYITAVTFDQEGKYAFEYRSIDQAGNIETAKTISFNLDATVPEITITGFGNGDLSDASDIVPVVTLKDNMSGMDNSKTQVTLDGRQYQIGDTIQLYMLPLGTHTFAVSASDLAGNTISSTVTFKISASVEGLKQLVTRFTTSKSIDNAGISNSLQSKLQNSDLKSFIQEVQAQGGKHISNEAAGYLLRDAKALLP